MHKLAPASLYRLQTLATVGPRFYQITGYMRRLEALGLIAVFGRVDPEENTIEYRIPEAGHGELIERYGAPEP